MRIWTASLVFAMRFIPMTKADFTITHIFRENPTAQKWFGALHGVNLLKRRKTIKEDKHMNTKLMVAFIIVCVYGGLITFGYIEERHKNKKKSRPRDWHHEERQNKIS
jgi:hypothetical protein